MKKLSAWASHNKWKARSIILFCYIVLNCTGIVLGAMLSTDDTVFDPWLPVVTSIILVSAVVFYPSRNKKRHSTYGLRKSFDLALVSCTFLLVVCCANRGEVISYPSMPAHATGLPSQLTGTNSAVYSIKKPSIKKKSLRDTIRQIKKWYKKQPPENKTGLIILVIVLAVAALFGVAALACSISCGGAEGLALAVGIVGVGLVVFLAVRIIRNIKHGPRKKKTQPAPEN